MQRDNKKNFVKTVDFTAQTPKMQIERIKIPDLYRKAFFDKNEKNESEYSNNTGTRE